MNHLTEVAIKKEIAERGELRTPLSQLEITGCADCTLVSGVFMSEVPHTSMEVVFAGVLAFFDSIPKWMKCHFGVDATQQARLAGDLLEVDSQGCWNASHREPHRLLRAHVVSWNASHGCHHT